MTDQTMLYKSGPANVELGGRKLVYRAYDDSDIEAAEADGWHRCPDDAEAPRVEPSLLDRTAKDIEAALPGLTDEELLATLDGETTGKTRKGVIAAIEAEVKRRETT